MSFTTPTFSGNPSGVVRPIKMRPCQIIIYLWCAVCTVYKLDPEIDQIKLKKYSFDAKMLRNHQTRIIKHCQDIRNGENHHQKNEILKERSYTFA